MVFFTFLYGRSFHWPLMLVLWLGFALAGHLPAQTNAISVQASPAADTNQIPVAPIATNMPETNTAPVAVAPTSEPAPNAEPKPAVAVLQATLPPAAVPQPAPVTSPAISAPTQNSGFPLYSILLAFGSLGGFVLYQSGLTRAKNCGHTSTLLLAGVFFALIGYWAGGFAVQSGGIGDGHAALAQPLPDNERTALDHELGPMLADHHWGLMGSSGFFLITDGIDHNGNSWDSQGGGAALFLAGAAFLVITVAAAFGAGLERARLLPMAVGAFLTGAILYPLLANWTWGGGWLAELGREFKFGHGFVDQGGAVVVHLTAGTLALVIALILKPRYGRMGRDKAYRSIPGHNIPFIVLGTSLLLVTLTMANTFAGGSPGDAPEMAAVNTLLAASGGFLVSYLLAGRKRVLPVVLCRGLLGGAVAVSAGSMLIDPWAAFIIGAVAALVVFGAMNWLDWRRIDDPAGACATHGAAGTWGALALGLFADGHAHGYNGIAGPVRGLFFGGAWRQLAAQAIGVAAGFLIIFILGFICFGLIQKILGTRADLVEEVDGLDWPQTGALGYQADVELEEPTR
jgi:Amt family ammonium transporter